jgi:hypothetical protein
MAERSTRIVDRVLSVPVTMTPMITSVADGLHYARRRLPRAVLNSFGSGAGELVTVRVNERAFDEPSMGLPPKLGGEVFDALHLLQAEVLAIRLIEQSAPLAFELPHRGCLMRQGVVVFEGSTEEMSTSAAVRSAYLGD